MGNSDKDALLLSPLMKTLALLFCCTVAAAHATPPYRVIDVLPHDSQAYTQGLELHNGVLFESSGRYGKSWIQRRHLSKPATTIRNLVNKKHFAEGLTILKGQGYLLTWRSGQMYWFNPETMQLQGQQRITPPGEKQELWGLTNDGQWLIKSDGSDTLTYLNPRTLKPIRRLVVRDADGEHYTRLNELEYIHGEIFANVWQKDEILRIDAKTGLVLQVLSLTALRPDRDQYPKAEVLNGIAWDEAASALLVTGKYWPRMYRLQLTVAPGDWPQGTTQ